MAESRTESLWDCRNPAHLRIFLELLHPLVVASRSREFSTFEVAKHQLIVWIMSLAEVPLEVLQRGVARLMAQGVTWMPRPGDLREACRLVIDDRRRAAARQAQADQAACVYCAGLGWSSVVIDGIERLQRCACWTAGQARMAAAGTPLEPPRLPAAAGEDAW